MSGIAERYGRASRSSHLKLGIEPGDLDLIIAAGLVPDSLGTAMFRLQAEYDGVRATHAAAADRLKSDENMARGEKGEDDETGETAEERSKKILENAKREALTAHVLILVQLTTLRETKQRFGAFSIEQARKRRLARNSEDVMTVAGHVLDVWLRPTCHQCDGRGFNGGVTRGDPQIICRLCRGVGHRRESIGRDEAERRFAGHLLMETDAMLFEVARQISHARRVVELAKGRLTAASKGLTG